MRVIERITGSGCETFPCTCTVGGTSKKKKMQHLSVYMSVADNVKGDLFAVISSYFVLFIALAPPFHDHSHFEVGNLAAVFQSS